MQKSRKDLFHRIGLCCSIRCGSRSSAWWCFRSSGRGISVSEPVPAPVRGVVPVQGGVLMAGGDAAVPIPGGSDVPLTVPGVVVPVPEPAKLTLKDGKVVTWGDQSRGGDSRSEAALRGVDMIYSTERAFAAVVKDGTVVTWGD